MERQSENSTSTVEQALEAYRRGYQPVAVINRNKSPYGSGWTQLRFTTEDQLRASFERYAQQGAGGLGLILGEPSRGLIDVDLDHPKALRLRDYFLPPTPMMTGRPGRPRSHLWYRVEWDPEPLDPVMNPSTRRYTMPDGAVSVELRSTGSQTVIPPSVHPSGERYRWEGEPWGGVDGPTIVNGQKLAVQVASLGMASVLLDGWPKRGSRHEAYLALAGALLRYGDGLHPYWSRPGNIPVLITALAEATHDEDGAETRVKEVMDTTIKRLRAGDRATGWPRLAEFIGTDHAEKVRRMALHDVESLAGFRSPHDTKVGSWDGVDLETGEVTEPLASSLPPEIRNPMEERPTAWSDVDLGPYISGEATIPEPSVLERDDGKCVFYPGRVNLMFGLSESGKTWVSMWAAAQEMGKGDRVLYVDLEDEPIGTISRLRVLGVGDDDVRNQFRYVHPEGPLAPMEVTKFGPNPTTEGKLSLAAFEALLASFDPTLIIVDGMTGLYGLHNLDTNAAASTDVITRWLKGLCRGDRSTVIVIDHTGKGGGAWSSPIGAHHKIAMVQGTAIRVDKIRQPMKGEEGLVRLVVFKDRPGSVRQAATKQGGEQVIADVIIDSTHQHRTKITVQAPDEKEVVIGDSDQMSKKLAKLAEAQDQENKVIELLKKYGCARSKAEIADELKLDHEQVYDALAGLRTRQVVRLVGGRKNAKYELIEENNDVVQAGGTGEVRPPEAGVEHDAQDQGSDGTSV